MKKNDKKNEFEIILTKDEIGILKIACLNAWETYNEQGLETLKKETMNIWKRLYDLAKN